MEWLVLIQGLLWEQGTRLDQRLGLKNLGLNWSRRQSLINQALPRLLTHFGQLLLWLYDVGSVIQRGRELR